MTKEKILIQKGKKDIKEFMAANPQFIINEFNDLHNYYDANCYVETLFNDNGIFMTSQANEVIDALDTFIKQ
jgi:hypothetical protein|tara:strand:+ start:872 stop:1087 length:216 start_codon:yes stop_codon:yes gene_type:complete